MLPSITLMCRACQLAQPHTLADNLLWCLQCGAAVEPTAAELPTDELEALTFEIEEAEGLDGDLAHIKAVALLADPQGFGLGGAPQLGPAYVVPGGPLGLLLKRAGSECRFFVRREEFSSLASVFNAEVRFPELASATAQTAKAA